MARTLFPVLGGAAASQAQATTLPLAQECAWDFEADRPIFRNGSPVLVTGLEAVKVWAYNALRTVRYRHEIWSFQYGCELERLVGQQFSSETKQAEASRYITDCLTASPYITEATVTSLSLTGGTLAASVSLKTVYGEEDIHV